MKIDEARKPWPEHRWKQLEELRELFIDCENIDNANCVLSRLTRIIETAKALNNSDREMRQQSFFHFLQELAIEADGDKGKS